MSCPATAFCGLNQSTADASKTEFELEVAAPNTDTNMHRAPAAHTKSANESKTSGKTGKIGGSPRRPLDIPSHERHRGLRGNFFMTFPEKGKVIKPLALRALAAEDN